MEFRRPRGTATFIWYPIKDGSGIHVSGVTGIQPQYATHTDGTAPNTKFSNLAGGVVEVGSTGVYYTSLTATEMANDYIFIIASPVSGSGRRVDLGINCTRIASVSQVMNPVPLDWASITSPGSTQNLTGTTIATVSGVTSSVSPDWGRVNNPSSTVNLTSTTIASVSTVQWCLAATPVGVATRAEIGDTIWGRDISATPTAAGTSGLMLAQIYATMSNGPLSTVTGVVNSVGVRSGTAGNMLNLSNGRVGINWGDIYQATISQSLTNTTIASVNNVATCNFVASAGSAILTNVATVTGVTNTVTATVSQASASLIADRFLARNLARGSDGTRTVQDALRLLRNRRALTTGAMGTATLTTYQEDDATTAWTAVVSTASATGLTDIDST